MAASFFLIITSATPCAMVVIFFFSVCYLQVAPVTALFFNYSSFSSHDSSDLRIEGEAYINRGWIDLTAFGDDAIDESRGRASYAGSMRLWDKDTGEVASFVTRFSFRINPPERYGGVGNKGAGMAFFLAGYPSSLPSESETYNLALTNQSADAVATGDGRFVAVEFDTFNDTIAHDPDTTYDHLGINVNSIRSVATEVLPSFSLVGNMTAEVSYDNLSTVLLVKLWLLIDDGIILDYYYLSQRVDLKSALPEIVSVGFSASTGTSVELHQLYSWYFNSSLESKDTPVLDVPPPTQPLPQTTPRPSGSRHGGVIDGAIGAALFVVVMFALAVFVAGRRRRSKRRDPKLAHEFDEDDHIGDSDDGDVDEIEIGTGPRRFPYHELAAATKCFSPEEKLGQGGFGSVYRGHLGGDHGAVAIKRFGKGYSSTQGRKEYKSEITVISRLRHRNLVQLVGWCHGRDELLLVYELVPNRSLDVHLHGTGGTGTFLTWPMRMRILLGLASALLYLHEEWDPEQCVVHRDVKPSNVMLDETFNAKLGDFGLARFIDHAVGMQTMTAVSGTPGYVDPESLITGKASAESDVYSFGVVVLEVACGRRPLSQLGGAGGSQRNAAVFRLVEWAWDLYGRGAALAAADERLNGEYDAAEVERVVAVGLWCAHPDPRARPSIRAAMAALQSSGPVPALPAKMPVPTYAVPVSLVSYTASTQGMTWLMTQSSLMTITSGANISAS